MPTILCYGDSNTHGTMPLTVLGQFARYPRGTPWPDVMAAAARAGILRDFRRFAGTHDRS
jgi:lysophospholipase L1-like esterase